MTGPRAYIQTRCTNQTVRLAGRFVAVYKLAADEKMDHSYVWRILTGERVASVAYYSRLSKALVMSLPDLLQAIDENKTDRRARKD